MRKNGGIGVTFCAPTASSTDLIESPRSSCARKISEMPEFRMRFTTKPGTSAQVIGFFLIVWAKLIAAWIVSGDVSSPWMISISGMIDAG